jgi:hypothetical protein
MRRGIRIGMNRDQIVKAEQAMTITIQSVDQHICHLGKDITTANDGIELIYEHLMARTPKGRWLRFKSWLAGKK